MTRTRLALTSLHSALILTLLLIGPLAGPLVAQDADAGKTKIEIEVSTPQPMRTSEVQWWAAFRRAAPQLAGVQRTLRTELRRWSEGRSEQGCAAAQEALSSTDLRGLKLGASYQVVSLFGRGVEELRGAVMACRLGRFFEFDYRLRVSEWSFSQVQSFGREARTMRSYRVAEPKAKRPAKRQAGPKVAPVSGAPS